MFPFIEDAAKRARKQQRIEQRNRERLSRAGDAMAAARLKRVRKQMRNREIVLRGGAIRKDDA